MLALNVGSGQRPFNKSFGWINVDMQEKWNPDVVTDWNDLSMFESGTMDYVVSHHSLEHVGCGEGSGFVNEAHRVLKVGGSLLVFVPNLRALAQRWLTGQLSTQIYMTNVYGPFDGTEPSRHRWGYDNVSLSEFLHNTSAWSTVKYFDWRDIPGADIARDWHITAIETVK